MNLTYELIAGRIDHALLLPTMTNPEMLAGCRLAAAYKVASVCIKPAAVQLAVQALRGTVVQVGTVVGFPHGGQTTRTKLAETQEALQAGATEIDMVVSIGQILGGDWRSVEDEIVQLTQLTHEYSGLIKVIFETCYLNADQKIQLCEICGRTEVDYVKTSTGFGPAGATKEDLILMRRHSPSQVKLKASGGIRDLATAVEFIQLGSDRLGLSRTAEILEELCVRLGLNPKDVSRETNRDANDY